MKVHERPVITMAAAIDVVDGCVTEANRLGVAVVISVFDPGGHPVAFTRMDGAPMLSIGVAADKAWTVTAFGHPTARWSEMVANDPSLSFLGNNSRFMPLPGGVPLILAGSIVGAVGVSGATGEQDHRIAEAGAGTLGMETFTMAKMEAQIRGYFEACNSGDPDRVAAFFTPGAVHYFPPGMYEGPFVGAETIGRRWAEAVANLGSVWTVDGFVGDPYTAVAAIEWTHFKTKTGTVLRGDEWYRFDRESGLIAEIRAYYASPQDSRLERLELGGFDYPGRGYPLEPPDDRRLSP
jgi:uncharacterized protein GlcG (DUF336 family)